MLPYFIRVRAVLVPVLGQAQFAETIPQQSYTSFPINHCWGLSTPPFTMPTLKNYDFKEIYLGPTRTCPECEEPELEITKEPNIFECTFCGAKWHRLQPTMTSSGKMTRLPEKLKQLLKKKRTFQ